MSDSLSDSRLTFSELAQVIIAGKLLPTEYQVWGPSLLRRQLRSRKPRVNAQATCAVKVSWTLRVVGAQVLYKGFVGTLGATYIQVGEIAFL